MTSVRGVTASQQGLLLADPFFLYVGRSSYRSVNWKGSIWANPFKIGMSRKAATDLLGRDIHREIRAESLNGRLAIAFYRAWIDEKSGLLAWIPELHGKKLACWCTEWRPGDLIKTPCHAIVLAQLANQSSGYSPGQGSLFGDDPA